MKITEAREVLENIMCSTAIHKRSADWLEKTSVASFAVGVFQAQTTLLGIMGIIFAFISGAVSFWLTLKIEKENK